jgi:hypothetical protein
LAQRRRRGVVAGGAVLVPLQRRVGTRPVGAPSFSNAMLGALPVTANIRDGSMIVGTWG